MSCKKITIKDVAREAGVSVATVSYVINNRTDIKISDETKKKVLQVSNLLNYTPNQAAIALATNRKSLFAFACHWSDQILIQAQQMYLLQYLSNYFHLKNYELLVISSNDKEKCDQADAMICYDMTNDHFHQLGDSNFIPLVALDCIINDPLFFQVNSNPEMLFSKASSYFQTNTFTYLCLSPQNEERKVYLQSHFPKILFVSDPFSLSELSSQNLLVTDYVLYEFVRKNNNVCYEPSISSQKCDALFQCIESAMERVPIETHHILV